MKNILCRLIRGSCTNSSVTEKPSQLDNINNVEYTWQHKRLLIHGT